MIKIQDKERSLRKNVELRVKVVDVKPWHNLTDKGTKSRDCAICHSSEMGEE